MLGPLVRILCLLVLASCAASTSHRRIDGIPMKRLTSTVVLLGISFFGAPARAQNPTLTWEQRFDGGIGQNDYGEAIEVDGAGDVYVVGFTFVQQSPSYFIPKFLTLKYDQQGQLLWMRTFGYGFNGGMGAADLLALDGSGNVHVAGQVQNGDYWAVVKYDPSGNLLWSQIWATSSAAVTDPSDMVLTPAGDVLLAGDDATATVIKIDAAGNLLWSRQYAPSSGIGSIRAIDLGPGGDIFVSGSTSISGSGLEFSVARLDAAGNLVWLRNSGYPGAVTHDFARDVVVHPSGLVIACGQYGSNTIAGSDAVLVAYDLAGNPAWTRIYDGPVGRSDSADRLALAPQGRVRAAGYTRTASSDYDAVTLSVDAAGGLHWARLFGGAGLLDDLPTALDVDAGGRTAVVGSTVPLGGGEHYMLIEYDDAGSPIGEASYSGFTSDDSSASGVAFGPTGVVFVTGDSAGFGTQQDVVTLRYDVGVVSVYCTAKSSSIGCLPAIAWTGTPSATSGTPFLISASAVISNKSGILAYGKNGPAQVPFQGGTLCMAPPILRTTLQSSGGTPPPSNCSGKFSFDFNAYIASGKDPALAPGQQVNTQYWFRDPGDPFGSGLSNALGFTIQP
jgi:hypothetical protein